MLSQDPTDAEESSIISGKTSAAVSTDSLKLVSQTKVVPRRLIPPLSPTLIFFFTSDELFMYGLVRIVMLPPRRVI